MAGPYAAPPSYAPQGGAIAQPYAGFGARLGAALLDGLILAVVGFVVGLIIGAAGGNAAVAQVLTQLIGLAYYVYLEGSSGQTIGKKALNIRVQDINSGTPIGFGRAFIRYIGRFISAIVLLLGYFWMLWDDQKQCWHDKFANDVVVRADAGGGYAQPAVGYGQQPYGQPQGFGQPQPGAYPPPPPPPGQAGY